MAQERTIPTAGFSLKPHGCSRYVSGAFLAFWLCGWAAGEAFALWVLVQGGRSLLTGDALRPGHEPLTLGFALAAGLFILFWLTLWTIGGIAAFLELFRLWWGEDRLEVAGGCLIVHRIRGPFRKSQAYDRTYIRSIELQAGDTRLVMECERGNVELSRLGTQQERVQGAAALRAALGIPEEPVGPSGAVLPKGWEAVITPEGARVLVADRSVRQKQARSAFIGTLLLASMTFVVARNAIHGAELIVPSIILLVFTLGALAGTLWLQHGRYEWRIERGLLTLRKRYGMGVRSVFQGRHLLLDHASSEGDPWLELYALSEPDPPSMTRKLSGTTVAWHSSLRKNRRLIAHNMNDTRVIRELGQWLAGETGIELEDRTTAEARVQDLALLRSTLEASGRFGRLAAKLVDRMGERTGSEK